MFRLPTTHAQPIALGMTSLVLGTTALLLFFLPILGLPLSAVGMFIGLIGVAVALGLGTTSLRWSVLGVIVCAIALAIHVALAYAPAGYLPGRAVPQSWQSVPGRPWVPPPLRPGFWGRLRLSEFR